ncbi:hypothetical protein HGRIS_006206 [Hohenbuehelia grisea]|uniref:Hydrophobin n=1 Tax=Hohenbuehelia grisea TaxID=104357 RepID=A0ABR3K1V6_9AGAR
MFAIVIAALAASAFASPAPATGGCSASTGKQMCCNSVVRHTDPSVVSNIKSLGILNIGAHKLFGDIGLDCVLSGWSVFACSMCTLD